MGSTYPGMWEQQASALGQSALSAQEQARQNMIAYQANAVQNTYRSASRPQPTKAYAKEVRETEAEKAHWLKMEEWTAKADKARQGADMGQAELIAAVIDAVTSAGTLE